MSTETIKAPSGREFTYEVAGDPDRIEALVTLLCDSVTTDGTREQQIDNMFQAATCLFMEIGDVAGKSDWTNIQTAFAIRNGLSTWIARNAPADES